MDRDEDFLDEIIRERIAGNPEFPATVEAALERRRARRLAGSGRVSRQNGGESEVAKDDPPARG